MNINRFGSWVKQHQVFFHFTDPADGGLQYSFDKDTFLRVHYLVVALFKLAVYVNVLNIKT